VPRIARQEPARIRERVEVDGKKVAAVGASYGCSPANLYATLPSFGRLAAPADGPQLTFAVVVTTAAEMVPLLPEPVAATMPRQHPPGGRPITSSAPTSPLARDRDPLRAASRAAIPR